MVRGPGCLYSFLLCVGLIVLTTNIYLFTLVMQGGSPPPLVDSAVSKPPKKSEHNKAGRPHGAHHTPRHGHETKAPSHHHHHHHGKDTTVAPVDGSHPPTAAVDKPPKSKHRKNGRSAKELAEKKRAFQVSAEGYSNMNYTDALTQYEQFMSPKLDVEQSSNKFTDFFEDSHGGVLLPEEPIIHGRGGGDGSTSSSASAGGGDHPCDPRENRFTPERDQVCKDYLANPHSWRSIKPMSSILSTGRTIKFKVYLNNGAEAVMKISQKKFALEPSSEVMAFIVDRLLKFNRVPPVEWLGFPVKYLKAACATKGAFYSQWFDQFVLQYHPSKELLHEEKETGEKLLYVSLQLWMSDVHDADETVLKPPPGLRKLLDASIALPTDLSSDAKTAATELSDLALFDFIIGNTDRWTGHNSFVFGGCQTCVTKPGAEALGPSTYAYIDQGSSFYRSEAPDHNLYYKGNETDKNVKLCRFRARTVESITATAHPAGDAADIGGLLQKALPKGIMHLTSRSLIKGVRKRLDIIARMMENCEKTFTLSLVRSL